MDAELNNQQENELNIANKGAETSIEHRNPLEDHVNPKGHVDPKEHESHLNPKEHESHLNPKEHESHLNPKEPEGHVNPKGHVNPEGHVNPKTYDITSKYALKSIQETCLKKLNNFKINNIIDMAENLKSAEEFIKYLHINAGLSYKFKDSITYRSIVDKIENNSYKKVFIKNEQNINSFLEMILSGHNPYEAIIDVSFNDHPLDMEDVQPINISMNEDVSVFYIFITNFLKDCNHLGEFYNLFLYEKEEDFYDKCVNLFNHLKKADEEENVFESRRAEFIKKVKLLKYPSKFDRNLCIFAYIASNKKSVENFAKSFNFNTFYCLVYSFISLYNESDQGKKVKYTPNNLAEIKYKSNDLVETFWRNLQKRFSTPIGNLIKFIINRKQLNDSNSSDKTSRNLKIVISACILIIILLISYISFSNSKDDDDDDYF